MYSSAGADADVFASATDAEIIDIVLGGVDQKDMDEGPRNALDIGGADQSVFASR